MTICLLLAWAGCGDSPKKNRKSRKSRQKRTPAVQMTTPTAPVEATPAAAAPIEPRANIAPAKAPPVKDPTKAMVPKPSLNRPIMVGGCLATCDEPRKALAGFLAALQTGKAELVRPYVNTAILVANGKPLGNKWAGLYVARKLAERNEGIEKWLKRWVSWVDRIKDPADRARVTGGVHVVEENQTRLVVTYQHPDFEPDPERPSGLGWRFVFQPRGLEWLVAEIDENPSE